MPRGSRRAFPKSLIPANSLASLAVEMFADIDDLLLPEDEPSDSGPTTPETTSSWSRETGAAGYLHHQLRTMQAAIHANLRQGIAFLRSSSHAEISTGRDELLTRIDNVRIKVNRGQFFLYQRRNVQMDEFRNKRGQLLLFTTSSECSGFMVAHLGYRDPPVGQREFHIIINRICNMPPTAINKPLIVLQFASHKSWFKPNVYQSLAFMNLTSATPALLQSLCLDDSPQPSQPPAYILARNTTPQSVQTRNECRDASGLPAISYALTNRVARLQSPSRLAGIATLVQLVDVLHYHTSRTSGGRILIVCNSSDHIDALQESLSAVTSAEFAVLAKTTETRSSCLQARYRHTIDRERKYATLAARPDYSVSDVGTETRSTGKRLYSAKEQERKCNERLAIWLQTPGNSDRTELNKLLISCERARQEVLAVWAEANCAAIANKRIVATTNFLSLNRSTLQLLRPSIVVVCAGRDLAEGDILSLLTMHTEHLIVIEDAKRSTCKDVILPRQMFKIIEDTGVETNLVVRNEHPINAIGSKDQRSNFKDVVLHKKTTVINRIELDDCDENAICCMSQKNERPILSGQRIKTRKRDEKEKYDPIGFRDAVIAGLEATSGDLEAISKYLDGAGNKLDYRRYGEVLFDILIAGGLLVPGGSISQDGEKPSTECCIFTAAEDMEAMHQHEQVFVKLMRRYKYLEKMFEEEMKKVLIFIKGFTPSERIKLARMTALWIGNGSVPPTVLLMLINEHLVKDEIALDFLLEVCITFKAEKGLSSLVQALKRGNIESRLMDYFPAKKQTEEHLRAAFIERGLAEVVKLHKAQASYEAKRELQQTLLDHISDNKSQKDIIADIKELAQKSNIPEHEITGIIWSTIMGLAEWNKKEELVTEQALKHLRQYTALLQAFCTVDRAELALILKVQEFCYENMNFMKAFHKIILLFYKANVVSEEAILKWYKDGHSAKGKMHFLEQMKKFIEWLQNAEEESESEEED